MLLDLPWHELEPHREWVSPHWHAGCRTLPYAAGAPDRWRVICVPAIGYLPPTVGISPLLRDLAIVDLEPGPWDARIVDPRTGHAVWGEAEPDATGRWRPGGGSFLSALPTLEDWLIVLRRP